MDRGFTVYFAYWGILSCALAFSTAWIGVEEKRSRATLLGIVLGTAQIPALVFALAYAYYGHLIGPNIVPALVVTGLVCAILSGSAAVFLGKKAFQIALVTMGAPLLLIFVYVGGYFVLPVFTFAIALTGIFWSVVTAFHRKRPPKIPH